MKTILEHQSKKYYFDFTKPIDISVAITGEKDNVLAWYIDKPEISPVQMGDFIGSVASGTSSTNFRNISFNPHAHGTHTECLGHITEHIFSINQLLKQSFFIAELISVTPEKIGDDFVITQKQIEQLIQYSEIKALIIRTLPNPIEKKSKNYSHTNPPYLDAAAATFIRTKGIEHLLIDLPSVDKEKDNGALAAHKAFWNVTDTKKVNEDARFHATITEFVYIPDTIKNGLYALNIQTAPFENDAVPSRPVLYSLTTF